MQDYFFDLSSGHYPAKPRKRIKQEANKVSSGHVVLWRTKPRLDIESLQSTVCDRQDQYLLESVSQYSDLLLHQDGQFDSTFHFKDSMIVSFFRDIVLPNSGKGELGVLKCLITVA